MPRELQSIKLPDRLSDHLRLINILLDRTTLFPRQRWTFLLFFFCYILYRIFTLDYLALLYFLGLSTVYLVIQYFTPQGLPDPDQDYEQNIRFLEQSRQILVGGQGDRPILRTLGEFTLWKYTFGVGLMTLGCTCFEIFLIPVYWPFLLMYFLLLIGIAVAKHWKHMKKYGYQLSDFQQRKKGSGVMI